MLHLSKNRAAAAGGEEDDMYPIPRTPVEQAEYEQECHNGGCPGPQHLDAEGARARACRVYEQIQHGKGETPVFPRATKMSLRRP